MSLDISTYIYIAFGAMAFIGFLVGLLKGAYRSIADFFFMVFNIVVSVIASVLTAKNIAKPENLCTVLDKAISANSFDPATLDTITQLRDNLANPEVNTKAVTLIVALVSVVILPLVFMILYFAFAAVMKIPKLIVEFVCVHKTRKWSLKLLGGGIGAISAVIALAVFIMPIVGYIDYASNTMELLKEEQIIVEQTAVPMESQEGESTEAPALGFLEQFEAYAEPIQTTTL